MLPVVTIIGRPNVGKSTIFNRLTKTKAALVVDLPGTTRDRNYGFGKVGDNKYIVVDTAGINDEAEQNNIIINQVKKAIAEARIILFVVDATMGLMAEDLDLAKKLRKFSKKVILVINKIDGVNMEIASLDFFRLGFENIIEISAKANRGINKLGERFINEFSTDSKINNSCDISDIIVDDSDKNHSEEYPEHIKVAIIGQPNVGKSTLINNILGEERVVVFDSPGTTRDSIYIPTQIGQHKYMLIDTAGVRRRSRIKDIVEKFSVIKTLQAIDHAQVVILLIDAQKGLVEQDLKLVECIVSAGRSIVIAVNKWDTITKDKQKKLQKNIQEELHFIYFIKPVPISALYGTGIRKVFNEVLAAFKSSIMPVATNKLSLLLQQAIEEHQPPLSKGRRIKLRYAHLGGHLPFTIIIHGTQAESVPMQYKKYLSSFYREKLQLHGTMVNIVFKNSDNPYV